VENASLSPEINCASILYNCLSRTPSPTSTPASRTQSFGTTSPSPSSVATYLTHLGNAFGSISNLPFMDELGIRRIVRAYRMVQQTRKPNPLQQRDNCTVKRWNY
jgi:hypothetical protein